MMRLHEMMITPGILKAMKRMLDGHDSFAIQDIYDNMNMVKDMEITYVSEVITDLRQIGIRWPELATIERSIRAEAKK